MWRFTSRRSLYVYFVILNHKKKYKRKNGINSSPVQRSSEVLVSPGSGGSSRLESVGEDDELLVENGVGSCDVSEKPPPGRRKHSLPQQLDTAGVRQVGEWLRMNPWTCSYIVVKLNNIMKLYHMEEIWVRPQIPALCFCKKTNS